MATPESRHQYVHENHRIERFVFADAAARAAGSGLFTPSSVAYTIVSDDIGQICFQTDTQVYYRLTAIGPLVWLEIGGATGALLAANNLSDVANTGTSRTNLGLGTAAVHTDAEYTRVDGTHAFTADQPLGGHKLTGVADPVSAQDAATKAWVQSQIVGEVVYQGTWNATTNSPALTSGTGTNGQYYRVATAGTTTIDGVSEWNVGDLILFNGVIWERIVNTVDDATGSVKGVVQLAGDLAGSASSPAIATNAVVTGKIADANVTLAKIANIADQTILGNNTGSAGPPLAFTPAQAAAVIAAMVGDTGAGGTKGEVPAPAAGDAAAGKFLKADASWAVPAGGGGGGLSGLDGVPGIFSWIAADHIVGLVNTNPVASWADSSGNSNPFLQATSLNQPEYITGILNSLPVVLFNGSNSFMNCMGYNPAVRATMMIVTQIATGNPLSNAKIPGGGGGMTLANNGNEYLVQCSDGIHGWASTSFNATFIDTSVFEIITIRFGAGSLDVRVGGIRIGYMFSGANTILAAGDTTFNMIIGALNNNGSVSGFLNGQIAEAGFWNRCITENEASQAEQYLATKYAL